MSAVFAAEPNSLMAALRSEVEGEAPAFANSASTNCAGVCVVGYRLVNCERWTKPCVKATLFASSCASQPVAPTTTPFEIERVSGMKVSRRTGTGVPGMSPKAALSSR